MESADVLREYQAWCPDCAANMGVDIAVFYQNEYAVFKKKRCLGCGKTLDRWRKKTGWESEQERINES